MPMAMRKGVEVRRAPMAMNFFFSDFFSVGVGDLGLAAGGTSSAYRQGDRESSGSRACPKFFDEGPAG